MRLSFSQISKYGQCPRSYKLYYVDKLRERSATAFLAFGSAMDEALNTVLRDLQKNKKVTSDYKAAFDECWQTVEVNKRKYPLVDCTLVGYAKTDFVEDLLQTDDIRFIKAKLSEYGVEEMESYTILKNQLEEERSRRATVAFSENRHRALNLLNWLSMRRKAHLMLDAYVRDIVPKIESVTAVQKQVELKSDCGSSLVGYVDTIVRLKGDDEDTVLDNKTSASPYTEDQVKLSQQLSLYTYALGLKKAAYAVMQKNIRMNREKVCSACGFESTGAHKTCNNTVDGKRCNASWNETVKPEAVTQLIVDTIEEQTQHVVVDNIAEVNDAIAANVFPKNLSACKNIYGNPCPYMNACWKNQTDYLEKVE
jgi:RecB family exonuclease